MQFNRRKALVSMGIAATIFSGISVRAARIPRIELLREVRIADATVLLSDLLPASAPDSLRARAAEISLGGAPLAGETRILERDAVERRVGQSHVVMEQVAVPERIVVSRSARPITLAEVFAAIRTALELAHVPAADSLHPEAILLESQVFVNPGDCGLQVMRIDIDRGLGRARFLLWPSRDPKVLPFFVTARLGGDSISPSIPFATVFGRIANNGHASIAPARVRKQEVKPEILVDRGERATLELHSDGMRILVDVVPLEAGALGQQIRVRMLDGEKIFNAQVDGHAHLEEKF